ANNTRFAKDQLKAFVERIERLEEEKKAIADDIRDVYAESKANGFDTTALRAVVRLRKQDAQERNERQLILETYMNALGMLAANGLSQSLRVIPGFMPGIHVLAAIKDVNARTSSAIRRLCGSCGRRPGPCDAAVLCLIGAFGGVDIAVDDLQIWHAPI